MLQSTAIRVGAVVVLATAFILGHGVGVHATTLVAISDEALARSAAVIVLGEVLSVESARSPDGAIHTYVAIQPERVLKGGLPLTPFVLKEPGGSVGEQVERIYGAPEFSAGERVLLFLARRRDRTLRTAHLSLGKFSIHRDDRGREFVSQAIGHVWKWGRT
jgi:hypothetical protein